jgi:hypothetical protein
VSARRRGSRENLDVFDTNGMLSLEETDASIFGNIAEVDAGRQVAKPVSIFDIRPDATQPRRAVPSLVREGWNGEPDTVSELLARWYEMAIQERREEFDIRPYLIAEEEVIRPKKIGPLEASFLDVIELAASIRQHGLTNPITVARQSTGYRLETGERRWLAFHVLYIYENQNKAWEKIPARVVDVPDVWRQAAENGVRANLNAIGRARQLALLIMEIHRQKGATFRSYDEMVEPNGVDRAFYAQVEDGHTYQLTGYGETILNAMGFKQSSQLREHRDLLRLPDEVWRIADDLNWPQGRIRDLERKSLRDRKRFIQLAVTKALAEGYDIGISVPDSPAPPRKVREGNLNPMVAPERKRIFYSLWSLALQMGEGDIRATHNDLNNIRYMRQWLDELEKAARDNLAK